ncbi:MAG: hypothetical protein V4563_10755 [Pseudomonadota bacterium]
MSGQLFAYRIRWYALATKRLLLRHWQALLLAIGVLSPAAMPALLQVKFLAAPILAIFSEKQGTAAHFTYLTLLEVIGLLWSGLQRNNIAGGDSMLFISTLPISARNKRMVDLGILFLADSLLFLPVIAAAIIFATLPLPSSELISHYLVTGILISLVLTAQLSGLHQRFSPRLFVILAANILLSISLESSASITTWLLQIAALFLALSMVFMPESQRLRAPRQWRHHLLIHARKHLVKWVHPALGIQLKALFMERVTETFIRFGMSIALAAGADALINIEEYDYRSLPIGIIALAGIAIILSGFYRTLHSLHGPVSEFMRSLPVSSGFWVQRDTALVASLGFAPLCIVVYPLLVQHIVSLLAAGFTGITYVCLIGLLRFTQLNGGRQSVLLSTILAAAWAWFTAISVI